MCGIAGVLSHDASAIIERMTEALAHRGPDGEDSTTPTASHLGIGGSASSIWPGAASQSRMRVALSSSFATEKSTIAPSFARTFWRAGTGFPPRRMSRLLFISMKNMAVTVCATCRACSRSGSRIVAHDACSLRAIPWVRSLCSTRTSRAGLPLHLKSRRCSVPTSAKGKSILTAYGTIFPCVSSLTTTPCSKIFRSFRRARRWSGMTNRVSVERYWNLDSRHKLPHDGSHRRRARRRSSGYRSQPSLSDVPVGVFLSSSIDSSTIAAMVALETGRPFSSFSIGVDEDSFNELPYARTVAARYGWRHTSGSFDRIVGAAEDDSAMDEPSDPFALGVYLVSKLASEHVKVVLGGDGGDENFAGYDRFAGQRVRRSLCRYAVMVSKADDGALDRLRP